MRDPIKADPTRTKTLRTKFERALRGRLRRFRSQVIKLVMHDDVFGLKPFKPVTSFKQLVGNVETGVAPRAWEFATDREKLRLFAEWLVSTMGDTLDADEVWGAYVAEGYRKGAGRAFTDTNRAAIQVASQEQAVFVSGRQVQFVQTMLNAPETVEKLQILAERTFADLRGVNEVLATQIRKELADGLVQGDHPITIARRMADRIYNRKDVNGRIVNRGALAHANRIARTEIIRAHAEGTLDAFERLGVEEVGVAVEWSTAGDDRVCVRCESMQGVVLKVKESHGLIPLHAQCRCSWIPANVGESKQGQVRTQAGIRASIRESVERGSRTWAGATRAISKERPVSILDK